MKRKASLLCGPLLLAALFGPAAAQDGILGPPPLPPVPLEPAPPLPPDPPPFGPDPAPAPPRAASKPAGEGEKKFGTITTGTHRAKIQQWLGRPTLESNIPSLRRIRERYRDGTEIIYVEEHAISVHPSGLAECAADGSYLIETETASILVEPCVLRECGMYVPDAWDKCAIESFFYTTPPQYPHTLYNGIPFTQPFEYIPPSRRDMVDYYRARQPWKDFYRPYGPERPSPFTIDRNQPQNGHYGPNGWHEGHEANCPHCPPAQRR